MSPHLLRVAIYAKKNGERGGLARVRDEEKSFLGFGLLGIKLEVFGRFNIDH